MRIACLQFAPQVGDIDNNLNRADAVLSKADPDDIDLLVLPELAFTGYNFQSLQHISSYLEHSGSGITALWARTTALKYNCNVIAGYPEKVDPSPNWPTGPEYYNSAMIINGDGETVGNYRKRFLYYTDETWALEGNGGFYEGFIPGLGHTSMGICMDLNPHKFEAPWDAFEFANHVLQYQSNFVVVSMAWMTREDARMFSRMPNEPDMETLTYWITRLEPLIRKENEEEIIIVFCNRTGIEDDVVYAGTSAVVGIQDGEVRVYGILGRGEKELLVVDTSSPPCAKLVYRPNPEATVTVADGSDKAATSEASSSSKSSSTQAGQETENKGADEGQQNKRSIPPNVTSPTAKSEGSSSSTTSKSSHKKRRQAPQIQIPAKSDTARSQTGQATSATSTRSVASDIPTPSAPSPTPQSLRPKLIIPKSPASQGWPDASPAPLSSQSFQSVRSIQSNQSVMSDESARTAQTIHSVRSNQSVQSNGRPPAESTPYPDSGAPLSGYPRNRHILGGEVNMSFSPLTPFEESSPMSAHVSWYTPDSALRTAMDAGGWTPAGMSPVNRKRAFQDWPILTRKATAPEASTAQVKDPRTASEEKAPTPKPDATDEKHTPTGRSPPTPANVSERPEQQTDRAKYPTRPSSPKSRNASRSGIRTEERSASRSESRGVAADISQRLEPLQRADSVNRSRSARKETESSLPDRPSSPKSRNCSRSRPTEEAVSLLVGSKSRLLGEDVPRSQSAFSPDGSRGVHRAMSRMAQHPRSNSISGSMRLPRDRSRTPTGGEHVRVRPSSRASSRPPRQDISSPTPPTQPTTTSKGQTAHPPERRDSAASNASQKYSEEDFESFESIVCSSCPLHGNDGNQSDVNAEAASDFPVSIANDLREDSSLDDVGIMTPDSHELERTTSHDSALSGMNEPAPSDTSSQAGTVPTLSTKANSPSTPTFEPPTPKAMVFLSGDAKIAGENSKQNTDSKDKSDATTAEERGDHQVVA